MAIIKTAANMKVTVQKEYTVVSSTLKKDAQAIKIDATKESLMMNCLKKITARGESE
jgi:hypothetical protein